MGNSLPPLRISVIGGGWRRRRRSKARVIPATVAAAATAAVRVLIILLRRGGVRPPLRPLLVLLGGRPSNLAAKRAEFEGVEEAPVADVAGVGDAFSRPRLRPLVQENHLGAVDYVRLHRADVQILLYLRHSDNVVVRRPPYLNSAVVVVEGQAERTEGAIHTIQAIHIAFALVRIRVEFAVNEEMLLQQRLQPWRPSIVLLVRSHDSPVLMLDFADKRFLIIDRQL